jgi:hypothetical protein
MGVPEVPLVVTLIKEDLLYWSEMNALSFPRMSFLLSIGQLVN